MIRTVLAFLHLIAALLILFPFGAAAAILSLLGLKKQMALFTYRLAQGWARSLTALIGASVTVKGKENIPPAGGVCFVSNHSGYFDILAALSYCGRPFGFVAKKELIFAPFLNIWIYMLGGLFIDRKNVRKALATINKGVKRIKEGNGMIIFPEGHRSKDGSLLPFHPGSLKLATMAEAPIIPVAIYGSYNVYEKNKRVAKADVTISFLNPIDTAGLPPEERKSILCDKIHSVIEKELSACAAKF